MVTATGGERSRKGVGARRAAEIVASPWAAGLLHALETGPKTGAELRRRLGMPTKALTPLLSKLEAHGLIARLPESAGWVLTSLGRSLAIPLRSLREWAEHYEDRLKKAKKTPARKPTIIPITK